MPKIYPYFGFLLFFRVFYTKIPFKNIDIAPIIPYNEDMENQKPRYHLIKHYEQPVRIGDIYLRQIGRRFCESGERIPTHAHGKWFELTIVTQGSGTVITNGKATNVTAGDIYLSFPCDLHELQSNGDRLEYDFCAFYPVNVSLSEELSALSQSFLPESTRVFHDEKISYLVANAISEFSMESPHADILISSIFQQIIVYLLRHFNGRKHEKAVGVAAADILCYQIMNYIDTHIYEITELKEISQMLNYNYAYLSDLFKRTTGKTISTYYNQRRLETAKALITEKKKKVGEIAELLNYASPFSFSNAFKEKYGISPKVMQKNS